jgi:O-acetyl-ADP-ribose deacetylase
MQSPEVTAQVGDLTTIGSEAIVNAANEALAMGGGVCGAIFRAAGPAPLQQACDDIGGCPTGSAVATPAFDLERHGPRWIVHAVGPVWTSAAEGDPDVAAGLDDQLAGAYRWSLDLAEELGVASIAFPSISTGIFGFPVERAAAIAAGVVRAHRGQLARVVLVDVDPAKVDAYRRAIAGGTGQGASDLEG